jgi:hypothetical protein
MGSDHATEQARVALVQRNESKSSAPCSGRAKDGQHRLSEELKRGHIRQIWEQQEKVADIESYVRLKPSHTLLGSAYQRVGQALLCIGCGGASNVCVVNNPGVASFGVTTEYHCSVVGKSN